MSLTPGRSLMVLALTAAALLAGGVVWVSWQLQGVEQSMEARARLGQMTMQLQVVQNEAAAARQLANQNANGTNGVAAVAGNRMRFADGVLQGLYSQAATPPFGAADRQALAALLNLSRPLAGGTALTPASTTQLAHLQRALGLYGARLARQGLAQAARSARLRVRLERNLASFALGGVALLGLSAAYLAWGWRRQYAALRNRLRAMVAGSSAAALPVGRGFRALAAELDEAERRGAGMREAALHKLVQAEQAAAELEVLAGQLAEACAAVRTGQQLAGAEHFDKLLRGLQGLAAGLRSGSDRAQEIQDALARELPERRRGHAQTEGLAPALQAAGEKVEQLLLLCLNLRLALLHGQAEPAQLAALGEQLDPLCAEGIELARDIAQAGLALQAGQAAADAEPEEAPRADARPALASLREGLARQAQAAQTIAAFCGRLCAPGGTAAQSPAGAAPPDDELVAKIGELHRRLRALREEPHQHPASPQNMHAKVFRGRDDKPVAG